MVLVVSCALTGLSAVKSFTSIIKEGISGREKENHSALKE